MSLRKNPINTNKVVDGIPLPSLPLQEGKEAEEEAL